MKITEDTEDSCHNFFEGNHRGAQRRTEMTSLCASARLCDFLQKKFPVLSSITDAGLKLQFIITVVVAGVLTSCSSHSKQLELARADRDRGAYAEALQKFEAYLKDEEGTAGLQREVADIRRLYLKQQIAFAMSLVSKREDRTLPQYIAALRILDEAGRLAGDQDRWLKSAHTQLTQGLGATQLEIRQLVVALRGALRSEDTTLSQQYFVRAKHLDPNSPLLANLEPELTRVGFRALRPQLESQLRSGGQPAASAVLQTWAQETRLSPQWSRELERMLQEMVSGAGPGGDQGSVQF